jgi:septum formation protein
MNYPNLNKLSLKYDIILGSSSPRRKKLLGETKITFNCLSPNIFENQFKDEKAYVFAQRLAVEKSLSLQKELNNNQLVIGCDTIVVLCDEVLGKPNDEDEALRTLKYLSGKQHIVCTALAIANKEKVLVSGYDITKVFFNEVTEEQIKKYILTKEPMDKAGAYGIQGMGAFLVDRIEGCLDTVIGFPRDLLEQLAGEILNLSE